MLVSKGSFKRSNRGLKQLIKAIYGKPATVLHLTLHKKWFDQILSGEKIFEYREMTPYWERRLEGKSYDYIHFVNGYGKDKPWMDVEFRGITKIPEFVFTEFYIVKKRPPTYKIKLGKVLRKGNLK